MWPRAWAFGPRTSPTNTSPMASSASSHSTSTTCGNSDTREELPQNAIEVVWPPDVEHVTGAGELRHVEAGELARRDEGIVLTDDELHPFTERAGDVRRILAVSDCLHRTDERVGIVEEHPLVGVDRIGEELLAHRLPQRRRTAAANQGDRVGAARAPCFRICVRPGPREQQAADAFRD